MKFADALLGVSSLFLDTAPVIYFVEANPAYMNVVQILFDNIDRGVLSAVTSPVTLAECLIHPVRSNNAKLQQDFSDLIAFGRNTTLVSLDAASGQQAAALRVRYNLSLTDAFQIGAALMAGCDAFVTNDVALKQVTEIQVIVLDELEP